MANLGSQGQVADTTALPPRADVVQKANIRRLVILPWRPVRRLASDDGPTGTHPAVYGEDSAADIAGPRTRQENDGVCYIFGGCGRLAGPGPGSQSRPTSARNVGFLADPVRFAPDSVAKISLGRGPRDKGIYRCTDRNQCFTNGRFGDSILRI